MGPSLSKLPILNWREIEKLVQLYRPQLLGLNVDKVQIPARKHFSEGFLKGEWVFRLSARKAELHLLISVRSQKPFFILGKGKGPPTAQKASRSAFDLLLSKHLEGSTIEDIQSVSKERMILLTFKTPSLKKEILTLCISLVPTAPEASLMMGSGPTYTVIGRSRMKGDFLPGERFKLPDGKGAPEVPPIREALFEEPFIFYEKIQEELLKEALTQKAGSAEVQIVNQLKEIIKKIADSRKNLAQANAQPDWQLFGDLLKSVLHAPPKPVGNKISIKHYETGENITIPVDSKLNLKAQLESFYRQAQKKKRTLEDAQTRLETALKEKQKLDQGLKALQSLAGESVESSLKSLENLFPTEIEKQSKAPNSKWKGPSFQSADGNWIWIGRNSKENLELIKLARGNDLWLHLRGKPSSHAIISIDSGKSASLETLLDAATLVVQYSEGKDAGKTEVIYTFRKNVSKIKGSTQVKYTQEKSLWITPDPERLKRLME